MKIHITFDTGEHVIYPDMSNTRRVSTGFFITGRELITKRGDGAGTVPVRKSQTLVTAQIVTST